MKIYISHNLKKHSKVNSLLIMCDIIGVEVVNKKELDDPFNDAKTNLDALVKSDVFVIVLDDNVNEKISFEMGYVFAQMKRILILNLSGKNKEELGNDFIAMIGDDNYVDSIDELKGYLKALKKIESEI